MAGGKRREKKAEGRAERTTTMIWIFLRKIEEKTGPPRGKKRNNGR